ncbi:MAG TPA: type II secretion system protein [Patescibacteria group bacterium]|nr:type II secretion system protein [Patescibacteria group bacterium]
MQDIINTRRRAFTLIELLVVISIIGLLATLAVVSIKNARDKALYAVTVEDMDQMAKAAELYKESYGDYPPDTNTNIDPGLAQFLGGTWPKGTYPGSYFDWDNWGNPSSWATPGPPGSRIVQISLRFCTTVDSSDCRFPLEPWAAGFLNRSSVYYCIEGPCRSHDHLPIDAPGKCVNCGGSFNMQLERFFAYLKII